MLSETEIEIEELKAKDAPVCALLALEAWPEDATIIPFEFISAYIKHYQTISTLKYVVVVSGHVEGLLFARINRDFKLSQYRWLRMKAAIGDFINIMVFKDIVVFIPTLIHLFWAGI